MELNLDRTAWPSNAGNHTLSFGRVSPLFEDDPENPKNADADVEPEEAVDAQATMKSIMDKTDDVYGEENEITQLHVELNGGP